MAKKLLAALLAVSLFTFITPVLAFDLGVKNFFDNPAPPELVYPAGEQADISGKSSLDFRWSDDNPIETEGYEFKLYKGYAMNEAGLLSGKNLPPSANSLSIPSAQFENAGEYTWSLKRIANGGRKSDPAYNSFKIKK